MLISYKHKLNSSYEFHCQGLNRINFQELLKVHIFRFTTNKKKDYIVEVEEYCYNVFILKFYLKDCRFSRYKYSMLTNEFDAFRILSTLVAILLYIHDKINNQSSFGFIGIPIKDKEKCAINTKRFRVYQTVAKKYFSPSTFDHAYNIERSSYLLINRNQSHTNLKGKIEEMFNKLYVNA